jgi:hypothetical protein
MFLRRMRCPVRHAARASSDNFIHILKRIYVCKVSYLHPSSVLDSVLRFPISNSMYFVLAFSKSALAKHWLKKKNLKNVVSHFCSICFRSAECKFCLKAFGTQVNFETFTTCQQPHHIWVLGCWKLQRSEKGVLVLLWKTRAGICSVVEQSLKIVYLYKLPGICQRNCFQVCL